jgi:hypothetical protein
MEISGWWPVDIWANLGSAHGTIIYGICCLSALSALLCSLYALLSAMRRSSSSAAGGEDSRELVQHMVQADPVDEEALLGLGGRDVAGGPS